MEGTRREGASECEECEREVCKNHATAVAREESERRVVGWETTEESIASESTGAWLI